MGLIGNLKGAAAEAREAAAAAKGLLSQFQALPNRTLPQAERLIEKIGATIDAQAAAAGKIEAQLSDLVEDADLILEGFEDAPKWVQLLVQTGERLMWRYSNLAQDYNRGVSVVPRPGGWGNGIDIIPIAGKETT